MNYKYDSSGSRPLEQIKGLKIIDIGGANSFAHGYLDAIIDIREPQAHSKFAFVGDVETPEFWEPVLKHVKEFGKWDYAICTHTLEDLNNPIFVARMIEKIADRGLVVVPSKFRELARFQDTGVRGFMHHRWIFDIENGKLTGWPKHNFIETLPLNVAGPETGEELVVEWEGSIGLRYINDGMPYGTDTLSGEQHMKELYMKLLNNNL